jgi:integrase
MARARRGRGEGSVFQRKSDNRWVGTVVIGHDAHGKRQRRTVYGNTKAEALEALKRLQHESEAGTVGTAGTLTVGELLDKWLTFAEPRVQPATFKRYESSVKTHLKPSLGTVKLNKLTTEKIDAAMGSIAAKGRTCQNPFAALRRACDQARRWKLLRSNPCADVTLPRHTAKEFATLTRQQAVKLLELAEPNRLHALFVLLLTTGCRIGEALALHWEDVDLKAGRLTIRRSLEELSGKLRLKEPKTESGKRVVVLPTIATDALQDHRRRMLTEGLAGLAHVFCDTSGGFVRKSNFLNREWKPLAEKVGAKGCRVHDARHTVATLLVADGVSIRAVQGLLGHASPAITMKHYARFSPEMQDATAASINGLFQPSGYSRATFPAPEADAAKESIPESQPQRQVV